MANNTKKYVSLSKLSTFLDNLRNTFSVLSHKHTLSDITDYTVDSSLSSTSTNPVQNKVLDAEFEAISESMNALDLAIDGKSDSSHTHDDRYYTETEIDTKLLTKSNTSHNHDSVYYGKTAGETLANTLADVKEDVDAFFADATISTAAKDTLKEIQDYIDSDASAAAEMTASIANKADKSHTHTVANITDLTATATELNYMDGVTSGVQAQLDGKATSTHTHSNASLGQGHGDCYTAASTTEKVVDIYRYEAVTGGAVSVKFIYSVPASATMNINSKGAKPIYYRDSAIVKDIIKGGDTATFIYDGSRYHLISVDRWNEDIAELQATDGKVRQVLATANGNFRLLLTPSFQTETTTDQAYFDSDVYLNPYYNKIYGVDIDGNAGSASKLNADAGSINQPVYFADGVPVAATGVYSKDDHKWTLIYDSGEIPAIANSISGIDVSGYTNFEVLVRCYNDGDSHTTRTGSAIFTAQNGKSYQFPVWTNMFTKSISTASVMAQFKLVDGWLVCPYASKLTGDIDIFDSTEGGTAGNLTPIGSGMMKCTSPLSTLTISNLDQNSNYYFGMGSRVMVWGWNA